MKKGFFYLLFCLSILGCTKNSTTSDNNGPVNGYDFTDLLSSENLIDSILVFHNIGTPGIFKFNYNNKATINSIDRDDLINSYKGRDTLFYSTKIDSIRSIGKNWLSTDFFSSTIKFEYLGGLKSRSYINDANYYIPSQRQLGSYITYTSNNPTLIQFKYMAASIGARDSIKTFVKRKLNGDIDSVINQQSAFPGSQNGLILTFEYGSNLNKLNTNANAKELHYSYLYRPVVFDFNNFDNLSATYVDYQFMNEIFYDILFNNATLPTIFYYYIGSGGKKAFFFKYLFNSNNYVTSISIGTTPSFDPVINERIRIKYH